MREILFRGKRIDNGEWVEGFLLKECNYATCSWNLAIEYKTDRFGKFAYDVAEVVTETIGQFTGLTDKNGKKIFDGDILPIEDEIVAVVIFQDGCYRLEEYGLRGTWTESGFDECGGGWGFIECEPIDWYTIGAMEVIGNIHDNPELSGGCRRWQN